MTTTTTGCVTSTEVLSLSEPPHLRTEDPKSPLQGPLGQIKGKKARCWTSKACAHRPPGNGLGKADKKVSRGPERQERAPPGDLLDSGLRPGLPRPALPDPRVPRVWTTLSLFLSPAAGCLGPSQPASESLSKKSFCFLPTQPSSPTAWPAPWPGSGPAGRPWPPRASGSG